jgi:hypothetical protein
MNTDLPISTSFIQAINNNYIPLEDDVEEFISNHEAAERKETHAVLLSIVKELDSKVQQIDVLSSFNLSNHNKEGSG